MMIVSWTRCWQSNRHRWLQLSRRSCLAFRGHLHGGLHSPLSSARSSTSRRRHLGLHHLAAVLDLLAWAYRPQRFGRCPVLLIDPLVIIMMLVISSPLACCSLACCRRRSPITHQRDVVRGVPHDQGFPASRFHHRPWCGFGYLWNRYFVGAQRRARRHVQYITWTG